jgi:hypothetical protein
MALLGDIPDDVEICRKKTAHGKGEENRALPGMGSMPIRELLRSFRPPARYRFKISCEIFSGSAKSVFMLRF